MTNGKIENSKFGTEEGEACNRSGCVGVIKLSESEDCSCHINPPCKSCLSIYFYCQECGWRDDEN